MVDISEKKEKIISYLRINGPTIPVKLSKVIEMDPFFASAILSEILGEKRIKASHMRIGSSPLYFLEGQETQLEKMAVNLKSIEREAFEKLKEKKVLKDAEETPAIRVALRSIRDFAVPFKLDDQIMWRYVFFSEEDVRKMFAGVKEDTKKEILKEVVKEVEESVEETRPKEIVKKRKERVKKTEDREVLNIFNNGTEEKSEFFKEVKEFLERRKIEFVEEVQSDKKEVVAKVKINSDVGKMEFLLLAKNKKSVSKDEINAAVQRAIHGKMPCFIVIRNKPTKTIDNFIRDNSLVKIEGMN